MKRQLSGVVGFVLALTAMATSAQQLHPEADPILVEILAKHTKALETSFTVSIQAERISGKTNFAKYFRGKADTGWATRLQVARTSPVLREKTFLEVVIDRQDCRYELFEITKSGIRATYSDPNMPKLMEAMMQPPKLDVAQIVRRYRLESSGSIGHVPPTRTVLVVKDSFFNALRQYSTKDSLKAFPHRMEITWLPDRYLLRSLTQFNSDGGTISTFQFPDYHFAEVSESHFSVPDGYTVADIANSSAHAMGITKLKVDAGRAELVQAGMPTNRLAIVQAKANLAPKKADVLKANSKIAFVLVFSSLLAIGLIILLWLKLRSKRAGEIG